MPIVFAALSPHPPIIIPEVGGQDIKKVKKTIQALNQLSEKMAEFEPDTIIIISPHGLIYPDRFNICTMPKLQGDLSHFGHPEIKQKYENDVNLAIQINKAANKDEIESLLYDTGSQNRAYELDHGVMIPLYFFAKKLINIKVLPITYSYLDRLQHFAFGQIIAEIAQKSQKRIAIIASGDLSHRLIPQAPAGYNPQGKIFDQKLLKDLEKNDVQEILNYEEEFLEEAGECGYNSILILLGALDNFKIKLKILSYEGPFGVGYAVVKFEIKNKKL